MPTSTVENYVKGLYLAQQNLADYELVSMGQLAGRMGVSPGTVTSMIKVLAKYGMVRYESRKGSRLTRKGEKLALCVLRRHRLVELFLVQVLGLDWSEIHSEAERLEHAVSDRLLEKIDEYLGSPTVDPHGDPIPTADGEMTNLNLEKLSSVESGATVRVARVVDQSSDFLRLVDQHGLMPGKVVDVTKRDNIADFITLAGKNSRPVTLGLSAASKLLVEAVAKSAIK